MTIDVTKMIEPVGQALSPVGASLSEAWSAVLGDRIAAWRMKNAAKLQVAVIQEIKELGLKLDRTKIPERYAFAWFEEATKQDEPEIQVLFARLLARATAGDASASDRRHVEILTRLTPMDARVMHWLFENGGPGHPSINEFNAWSELRKSIGEEALESMEHVVALGVFEKIYSLKQDASVSDWETVGDRRLNALLAELPHQLTIDAELVATTRGFSLWQACRPAPQPETE